MQIQVHDGRVHMYFLEQAYARFYYGEWKGSFSFTLKVPGK